MMQGFQYKHGDRPLEGYTIQRGAGRGGFGEVYYALSDSGREVALKVIQGYEQIEIRGITQCMNLKSPHLVSIFDVKRNEQGKSFVIMEYVAGPSLRELIDQSPGGLGPQKAAFFLREIGKGLTYLHDCGIVHRDLKPANIFYENGYVKIGDYGLSKAISPTQHSGQTITVGTVHYMAPEIGAGMYDSRIDIYALGAVLCEMITGQPPFVGGSVGEILMKHISTEPDLSHIEEPFASVIRKAMAKNPDDRYQTVQEMVEAIFGADHIRNSVSHFAPESLTMVAGKVACELPAGKSSPVSNRKEPSTKLDTVLEEIEDRVDRAAERIDKFAEQFAGRMERMVGRTDTDAPAKEKAPQPTPDASRDPFDPRRRRQLAVITACAVAIAAGILSQGYMSQPINGIFLVLQMIGGGVVGIRAVTRGGKIQSESPTVQRLLVAGAGFVSSMVFAGILLAMNSMFDGNLANQKDLPGTFLAVLISMFLFDWGKLVSPARKERVSFGPAIGAGILALILAEVCGGIPQVAIGVLAGISLVLQIASPFDPEVVRRDEDASPGQPQTGPPGTSPAANKSRIKYAFEWSLPSSNAPVKMVPSLLRGLFLAAFVILLPLGVALLAMAGNSRGDDQFFGILLGVGSLMFSIFCLVKACQKTYRNLWGSFLKPVTMLLFALAELAVALFLGLANPRGDDLAVAIFLIIFFPVLFIVSAATPVSFFRSLVPSSMRMSSPPPLGAVSPYKRLWALLLAAGSFVGMAGMHRFYVGKIGTGIIWFLTWGLLGVGQIIDIIMIVTGHFRDAQGRRLVVWESMAELHDYPTPPQTVNAAPNPMTDPSQGVPTSDLPPQPSPVQPATQWPSFNPTPPAQTNLVLSLLGSLVLLIAFLVGLVFSLGVMDAVTAGLPEPSLRAELEQRVFGTPAWPRLVEQIGQFIWIVLTLLACALLILARRRAGGAHMIRAVLGAFGLTISLKMLRMGMSAIDWASLASLTRDHQGGQALTLFLNGLGSSGAIFSAAVLLGSILILAWPEKRVPLSADSVVRGGIA